jgi:hypothetical protein
MEEAMGEIDRRSALLLGLITSGTALVSTDPAMAQPYRPDEGQEVRPGVRRVNLGERGPMPGRDTVLPGYMKIVGRDFLFQPGVKDRVDAMGNDMLCQCIEGEFRIDHRHGHSFTAKKGDVWTCLKGDPEDVDNLGTTVAIMRVIHLLPA